MVLIKVTKEFEDHQIGDVVNYTKGSAKDIVASEFGVYVSQSVTKTINQQVVVAKEQTQDVVVKKSDASDTSDTSDGYIGESNVNVNNNITFSHTGIDTPHTSKSPSFESQESQVSFEENEKPNILFDEEQETVLHPSVGQYKIKDQDFYYFGFNLNMEYMVEEKIGRKIVQTKTKGKRLVLVNSAHQFVHIEQIQELQFTLRCDLIIDKPKWNVLDINKYTNCSIVSKEPQEIFDAVKKEYDFYIDFPEPEAYKFFPLWVIGTYFFDLFFSYPYIHLHGLKNTAKSKVMQLSSKMTFNSEYLGSLTNAVLFRLVSQNKPTLYIDEYEVVNKAEQQKEDKDIETLLNNGYKKGMEVARMEQENKKWVVKKFDVYCPKMIANISGLIGALPSRCIKFVMHRAKQGDDRGTRYPDKDVDGVWDRIRSDLYVFALDNWRGIAFWYNTIESEGKPSINNRDYELWRPILAIARFISKELFEEMKIYAEKKAKEGRVDEDIEENWDNKLIEVLARYVTEERFYYVKEITEELMGEFIERIDKDYQGNERKIYKKSHPSTSWVGRTLSKFSFLNRKKTSLGHQYMLSPKIIVDLVSRLQIEGLDIAKETQNKLEEVA